MITARNNTSSLNQNVLAIWRWTCASTGNATWTTTVRIITAVHDVLVRRVLLMFLYTKNIELQLNILSDYHILDYVIFVFLRNVQGKCFVYDDMKWIQCIYLLLILLGKNMAN